MTQNPFGDGGFDMGALLQQAQAMQAQLMQAQADLAASTVDGSVGGVTVTVSGVGEVEAVTFGPGSVEGLDAESLADLGDLVVAAYRAAKASADALASQALGPMAGGLPDLGALGGPLV